jgi:hypothetical protein
MRTMIAITLGLVLSMHVTVSIMNAELKKVKHMVDEVICTALELELTK